LLGSVTELGVVSHDTGRWLFLRVRDPKIINRP
jgi:hypothetical protein